MEGVPKEASNMELILHSIIKSIEKLRFPIQMMQTNIHPWWYTTSRDYIWLIIIYCNNTHALVTIMR
jgi:hypothetical protein